MSNLVSLVLLWGMNDDHDRVWEATKTSVRFSRQWSKGVSAYLSECRTWRYSLTRDVAPLTGEGTVAFIGLNPSTADETQDDPTIRRCIRFAQDWGFARLKMLNLYAYRATEPRDMYAFDPYPPYQGAVGPDNDCTIAKVVGGSDLVVCAWGAGSRSPWREGHVLDLIAAPHCLGLTKDGSPRHPLYVKADTLPQPFGHCPVGARFTLATAPQSPPREVGRLGDEQG